MNILKKTTLSVGLLLLGCSHVQSAVDIQLSPDIEVAVVNGESSFSFFGQDDQLQLNNGLNQLVVRVSKLIQGQGDLEKYRSEPMIITFDTTDTAINIQPGQRILNSVDANNYDDDPKLKVFDKSGSPINAKFDLLKREGKFDSSALFSRNYLKDVAIYNKKNGYSFVQSAIEPEIIQTANIATLEVKPKKMVKTQDGSLQSQYLNLTTEQRKAFLQWAIIQ